MAWEKLACWSTKAAISLERVCDRGKVRPMEGLQEPTNALSNGTIPKLQIWPVHSQGLSEQKTYIKILEKRSVCVCIQGLQNVLSTLCYLRNE